MPVIIDRKVVRVILKFKMVNQEVSRQKATGSHFTPDELAKFVAKRIMATKMVAFDKPVVALDLACGIEPID